MDIGVMIFATDQTMPMHRLAPEVEARGFESLWVTEKTHVPASRRTAWPGGELPEWYLRTSDPFIALAGAAATTTTLRVGTGVALVGLRDPVITAKTIATLDWQSAGRLELGVGYGWNEEEMATHGVALADGPARLAESLALMRALWGNDIGEFAGEHVAVEPSWSWPKPTVPGGPPVHLGARAGDAVFADIAAWGDGWIPLEGYGPVVEAIPRLRHAFEAAGRDPGEAQVTVYSSAGRPDDIDRYRAAGVNRVVCWLPPTAEHELMAHLDGLTTRLGSFTRASGSGQRRTDGA